MRYGFTTGSCAAAAAKAAAYMLLTGKVKENIVIQTPKGLDFHAEIVDIKRSEKQVSCAVVKDGGDDPDVTTGAHIVATVSMRDIDAQNKELQKKEHQNKEYQNKKLWNEELMDEDLWNEERGRSRRIFIDGGQGVGRVTKPGLDQQVGNAAINHVPREMIEKEVSEVCELCDYKGALSIVISVPEGEALAGQTFNPRLGIEGGISILGTSGVVEPMSSQALLDTIRVELNQKKALGYEVAAVSPGNYGLDFMKETFDYDLDKSVKCSNFIGDTIDMAAELGFQKLLLTGHIGKLIKVSGGMMNTHSKEGDCRMELLAAAAVKAGADIVTVREILDAVTTEEGVRILKDAGICEGTMEYVMERIMLFLNKRGQGKLEIGCMMYATQYGMLAESENARRMLVESEKCEADASRR